MATSSMVMISSVLSGSNRAAGIGVLAAVTIVTAALPVFAQTGADKFKLLRAGKLPRPMHMHGTAVVGNRLYIMGGNYEEQSPAGIKDRWPKAVYSAEIKSDSTLTTWRAETPMPETRAYIESSVQVINDRIYILGGNVHPKEDSPESDFKHSRDVLWTRVNPDGTLAPWQKSEPFASARSCAATCASDRFLYLLGGTTDGSKGMADISCADIAGATAGNKETNADHQAGKGQIDTPRNWRKAGDLPVPLWYMGAAILEETMYVWGGFASDATAQRSSNRVFSCVLKADGTTGPWREESTMRAGINAAGFCGFNDYLVSVAGRLDGGLPTSGIQFAHLQEKKVDPWLAIDSDIQARVYHSLGLDRRKGVLYITGGRFRAGAGKDAGAIQDVVQAFQLPQRQPKQMGGSQAPTASGGNPAARFNTSLKDAFGRSAREGKKVLVLFHSPAVPAVQRLYDNALNKPEFDQQSAGYICAAVDVSGAEQAIASHYGVYRVPCLAELDVDGKLIKRSIRLLTAEDVKNFLTAK